MQNIVISKENQEWNLLCNLEKLEGAWITAEELGRHLGYEEPRIAVMKIYNRHIQAFENKKDTAVTNLVTIVSLPDGRTCKKEIRMRIFPERGTLKIIRYSETKEADRIMDHVFDVFLEAQKKIKVTEEFVEKMLIEKMILPAPRSWIKAFPDSFGEAVFKLYNLGEYKPGISSLAFSSFVSTYVYRCAPPGIYEKLLQENPKENGEREFKHHQFLSDEAKTWLFRQLSEITTLIRCSRYNVDIFKNLFSTAFPKIQTEEFEKLILQNTDMDIKQLLFEF